MTKTKRKKKVFKPTQVDKMVGQVADLAEEAYCLSCENEDLHGRIDALSSDMRRLEALVGTLQATVNGHLDNHTHFASNTTTYTATFAPSEPWYKRVFSKA